MNALVRHTGFPIQEKLVLVGQTGEGTSLERISLDVFDATFHFALVTRRVRFRRQNHRAVIISKRLELGMNLWVVPIRLSDSCLEIVDHEPFRGAPEMTECILQALHE